MNKQSKNKPKNNTKQSKKGQSLCQVETDVRLKKLDLKIKELFFPDEPVKQYSFHRGLAARIVEKIIFCENKEIRNRFNSQIEKRFRKACIVGKFKPTCDLFLLWALPSEICEVAINAILQSNYE